MMAFQFSLARVKTLLRRDGTVLLTVRLLMGRYSCFPPVSSPAFFTCVLRTSTASETISSVISCKYTLGPIWLFSQFRARLRSGSLPCCPT
jgi:hypothetical protein